MLPGDCRARACQELCPRESATSPISSLCKKIICGSHERVDCKFFLLKNEGCFDLSLLQNNLISGRIPAEIGKLGKLQTLDLSNNQFSGEIPGSLGDLRNLNYL